MVIYCDNQNCITLTKTPKFHIKTEDIEINHFERRPNKEVELVMYRGFSLLSILEINYFSHPHVRKITLGQSIKS